MNKEDQDRVIAHVKNMIRKAHTRRTKVLSSYMGKRAADEANLNDFISLRLLLAKIGSDDLQKTGASACKD